MWNHRLGLGLLILSKYILINYTSKDRDCSQLEEGYQN